MTLKFVVRGNLKSDGTLELDQKPTLGPGRVQVTLQPVAADLPPQPKLIDVLNELRAAQRESGIVARSREAIDAEIQQMRGGMGRPPGKGSGGGVSQSAGPAKQSTRPRLGLDDFLP